LSAQRRAMEQVMDNSDFQNNHHRADAAAAY